MDRDVCNVSEELGFEGCCVVQSSGNMYTLTVRADVHGSFFINLKGFEFSQNNEELSGILSQETQWD